MEHHHDHKLIKLLKKGSERCFQEVYRMGAEKATYEGVRHFMFQPNSDTEFREYKEKKSISPSLLPFRKFLLFHFFEGDGEERKSCFDQERMRWLGMQYSVALNGFFDSFGCKR